MPQSRRLLATLSSIPTATPSPTFVPPYAHSGPSSSSSSSSSSPSSPNSSGRTGASRASLRAPYAHSIKPIRPAKALTAPYDYTYAASANGTFTGLSSAQAHERWAAWAREQLAAPSAAIALWEETLERLAVMADTQAPAAAASSSGAGAAVQEVSAIDVPAFLRDEARVARIKEAGSLVVRDAVPDHLALGWAREVADELRARGGDATYWHPALLAARSNPSLLSTISSVMSAVTPYNGHEAFMQVQAVREGLGAVEGVGRVMDMADIWAIDESIAPISPLHSALALTPSPTPLSIPSSILASTYRTLRPLFQPLRSRISFYSGAEYLASSNWSIISPASIPLGPSSSSADSPTGPTSPAGLNAAAAAAYEASLASSLSADLSALTSAATDLPHLAPALSQAISLNPGDLILYHRHLPIQSAAQAFLPLTMLPNTSANAEYIQAQRGAYERGLPPPAEAQQGDAGGAKRAGEERAVRVEKTNGAEGVSGWRGKKVMGY